MSEAEAKERDLKTALLTEDGRRRRSWPKDAGRLQEAERQAFLISLQKELSLVSLVLAFHHLFRNCHLPDTVWEMMLHV